MLGTWVTVFTATDNEKQKVKTYISFHILQAQRESEFIEVLPDWCAPTEGDRLSWWDCTQC